MMMFPCYRAHPTLMRSASTVLCAVVLSFLAAATTTASADENFFTHLHTDKAMANVTVTPDRSGPVEITIQLETVDELPLVAKAVSVTLSDPRSGTRLPVIPATRTGEDQWRVTTSLPSSGRWTLALGISLSDTDKVNIESPIVIR